MGAAEGLAGRSGGAASPPREDSAKGEQGSGAPATDAVEPCAGERGRPGLHCTHPRFHAQPPGQEER